MVPLRESLSGFVEELKRRRVVRVAVVYGLIAWVTVQVANDTFPALQLPEWTVTFVVAVAALGFPIAIVLAWLFELTPDPRRPTAPVGAGGGVDAAGATAAYTEAPVPVRRAAPFPSAAAEHVSVLVAPAARPRVAPAPAATRPPDPDRVRKASLAHLRHELRTPINAILGYSEMLLEDVEDEDGLLASDLSRIHGAGSQLLAMVDRILHPARIAAAGAAPDLKAFHAELQHDLREPISAVIGYAEMLVETSRDEGLDQLLPDLSRIREAAQRLLSLVERVAVMRDETTVAGTDEYSKASALAEEVLAKIRPIASENGDDPEIRDGSLLIVDDNAMNRDLLSRQLAREGYVVTTARDGREALELLRSRPFDLVLLDLMMPEVDGVETLRRMKGEDSLSDTPVIMISAVDEVDSVVHCIGLGAEDYLTKPFEPALLKARIERILEARRLRLEHESFAQRLRGEEARSARLLGSLVPASLVPRVLSGEGAGLQGFSDVTVAAAFLDGFARLTARGISADLLARRNALAAEFRALCERAQLETVRTSADLLLAVAGVPAPRPDHAAVAADLCIQLSAAAERLMNGAAEPLRLRVGLHSGGLLAGVLDPERLTYDFWGDGVDTAHGLAAQAPPGAILVSGASYGRLRGDFLFDHRGVLEVAGKGQMRGYVLRGRAGG